MSEKLNVNPEAVKKVLDTFLKVANGISRLTPTEVDDKIVGFLQGIVGEPWFEALLSLVLSFIAGSGNDDLKAKLLEMGALEKAA